MSWRPTVFATAAGPTMSNASSRTRGATWGTPRAGGSPRADSASIPARFYAVSETTDPFGATFVVSHGPHALLVTAIRDPFLLETSVENDYRVLAPRRITDPNGIRNAVAFDAVGRVVATAAEGRAGAGEGDSLAEPTTTIAYDLRAFTDRGEPVSALVRARELHGAANERFLEERTYSDGNGNTALTKVQAAPGEVPGHEDLGTVPRWIGSGRTVLDNKGNVVKQYEPYFALDGGYDDEAALRERGVTPILRYDALGRQIRVDNPDGTFEDLRFDPWRHEARDACDSVLESRWFSERGAPDPSGPEPTESRARAAWLSAQHAGTPTVTVLDSLGRAVRTLENNHDVAPYETRVVFDEVGNERAVVDDRSNAAETRRFDLAGNPLEVVTLDAGTNRTLPNVAGNPMRAWVGGDVRSRQVYDRMQRPTEAWARRGAEEEKLLTQTVYGESMSSRDAARAANLLGQVHQVFDGAGVVTTVRYDMDGNAIETERRLVADAQTVPDWNAAPALGDERWSTSQTFNAWGDVVETTAPDAESEAGRGPTEVTYAYDDGGALIRVRARLRGAAAITDYVEAITYDEKGQRQSITYGSGVTTTYDYDPLTYRLSGLQTRRGTATVLLQDLAYTYDAAGNITAIRDASQPDIFTHNARVEASTRYRYDALYRLVEAHGREHIGQNSTPTSTDARVFPIPHANDTQAMRAYTETYAYDSVGNLRELRHTFRDGGWVRQYDYADDSNRLRAIRHGDDDTAPWLPFAYNARGSMRVMPSFVDPSAPDADRLHWNVLEQLQRVELDLAGNTAHYQYDASGERTRKLVRKGAVVEERVYLGGWELYRRSSGSAAPSRVRETLHISDGSRRIALVETLTRDGDRDITEPEPVTRYQHTNHLDSATLELDGDGNTLSYEEYHPYGTSAYRAARGVAETSLKRYRYTGMERDEETGLGYHSARYYAPWLGRWTAADPAGLVDGVNVYGYALQRPQQNTDPSGHNATDVVNWAGSVEYSRYAVQRRIRSVRSRVGFDVNARDRDGDLLPASLESITGRVLGFVDRLRHARTRRFAARELAESEALRQAHGGSFDPFLVLAITARESGTRPIRLRLNRDLRRYNTYDVGGLDNLGAAIVNGTVDSTHIPRARLNRITTAGSALDRAGNPRALINTNERGGRVHSAGVQNRDLLISYAGYISARTDHFASLQMSARLSAQIANLSPLARRIWNALTFGAQGGDTYSDWVANTRARRREIASGVDPDSATRASLGAVTLVSFIDDRGYDLEDIVRIGELTDANGRTPFANRRGIRSSVNVAIVAQALAEEHQEHLEWERFYSAIYPDLAGL